MEPVAFWAHVGGFVAGMILMPLLSFGASPPGTDWRKETDDLFRFDDPRFTEIKVTDDGRMIDVSIPTPSLTMPRRALRKLDPALDLSFHLKTIDDLPRPWNATQLFPQDLPLEVEVGSGKGLFLQFGGEAEPGSQFPRHRDRRQIRPACGRQAREERLQERRHGAAAMPSGFSSNSCRTNRSSPSTSTSPIRGGKSGITSGAS